MEGMGFICFRLTCDRHRHCLFFLFEKKSMSFVLLGHQKVARTDILTASEVKIPSSFVLKRKKKLNIIILYCTNIGIKNGTPDYFPEV
jgi:hypothetical protein